MYPNNKLLHGFQAYFANDRAQQGLNSARLALGGLPRPIRIRRQGFEYPVLFYSVHISFHTLYHLCTQYTWEPPRKPDAVHPSHLDTYLRLPADSTKRSTYPNRNCKDARCTMPPRTWCQPSSTQNSTLTGRLFTLRLRSTQTYNST